MKSSKDLGVTMIIRFIVLRTKKKFLVLRTKKKFLLKLTFSKYILSKCKSSGTNEKVYWPC